MKNRLLSLFLVASFISPSVSAKVWPSWSWYKFRKLTGRQGEPDRCSLNFVSSLGGDLARKTMGRNAVNLWSRDFSLFGMVQGLEKMPKAQRLSVLKDLRKLANKDQEYINNLGDIASQLTQRKLLKLDEVSDIMINYKGAGRSKYYFSESKKSFIGKPSVDLKKLSYLKKYFDKSDFPDSVKKEYINMFMYSDQSYANIYELLLGRNFLSAEPVKIERFREYLSFVDGLKSSDFQKALDPKSIDQIYDFKYTHTIASYASSSVRSYPKKFLIQKSRTRAYKQRRISELKQDYYNKNGVHATGKQYLHKIANRADGESRVFNRLLNGCNGKGGKSLKSSAKKFSQFKFAVALATTPAFYFKANWDKRPGTTDEDEYFYERLGFEMVVGLTFTFFANKLFTNTSTTFFEKYLRGIAMFGGMDLIGSQGYNSLFGAQGYMTKIKRVFGLSDSDTQLEAKYKEFISSPDFEKESKKLIAYLEKKSEDHNLKGLVNKWFGTSAAGKLNDGAFTKAELESVEGQELLLEMLAEKIYLESMGDLEFLDTDWKMFQTGNTGLDRWTFYRTRSLAWDVKGLISNLAIFQIMCRRPLGNAGSWVLILGILAANEQLNSLTYEWRRKSINQ